MSRRRRCFSRILVMLMALSSARAQAQRPSNLDGGDEGVAALIETLSHPDPTTRARAAEGLRKLGAAARPAIVAASRSNDSALASAAGQILISMPWYRSDDPPAVRIALLHYGQPDEVSRIEVIGQIASQYPRAVARQILPRLLMEEPSEDVCWHIVAALRRSMDENTRDALRALDPVGGNRASGLTIVARAWLETDRAKAHDLLRRAIQIESQAPTYDDGELDFAFDVLAAADEAAGHYQRAAELRRQQSSRVGLQRDSYGGPVFELFALHARRGPLPGFDQDVQTYTVYLGQPQVLYALARIYQRAGDEVSAGVCARAAATVSLRGTQRLRAAQFLIVNGWTGWAQRELLAIVATPPEDQEIAIQQVNAHLRLAGLAREQRDHDDAAAHHLRAALKLIETRSLSLQRVSNTGRSVKLDTAELRGEIAWLEFRAARRGGDAEAAERHLGQVLLLRPSQSRVIVDLVPLLKSTGRQAEAQKLFSAAYAVHRKHLNDAPNDPNLMNELAWLCARSGERLDEALELSVAAVGASPGDAAHLDTAAEAHFQLGRIDDAIRLEQAALELRPDHRFFQEQLERFLNARNPSTRPSPGE